MRIIASIFALIGICSSVYGQCDLEDLENYANNRRAERILMPPGYSWISLCPDSCKVLALYWDEDHVYFLGINCDDERELEFYIRKGILVKVVDKEHMLSYLICDDEIVSCTDLQSDSKCDSSLFKSLSLDFAGLNQQLLSEYSRKH